MIDVWVVAASCFFAGLAAGFLGGLCTILRPMQAAMSGREFRGFMQSFLQFAGNGLGKAYNLTWTYRRPDMEIPTEYELDEVTFNVMPRANSVPASAEKRLQ